MTCSWLTFSFVIVCTAPEPSAFVINGVVVRSLENGNNAGSQARTKDGAGDLPPRLVINYTLPADDGQPRPDLGDAPDSSNHHAQPNTAYVAGGVLGSLADVY